MGQEMVFKGAHVGLFLGGVIFDAQQVQTAMNYQPHQLPQIWFVEQLAVFQSALCADIDFPFERSISIVQVECDNVGVVVLAEEAVLQLAEMFIVGENNLHPAGIGAVLRQRCYDQGGYYFSKGENL